MQDRVLLIQLPHLAVGTPAKIAVPSTPKVCMRDLLATTCRVEAGSELVGERLIMDKAIGMGGANGLFVKTLSVELAPLDTGDLRAHQCGAGFEVLRAIFRPYLELPMMGSQSLE